MGGLQNAIMSLAAIPATRSLVSLLPSVKRFRRLHMAGGDAEEAVEMARDISRSGGSFGLVQIGEPVTSNDAIGRNLAILTEAMDMLGRSGLDVSITLDVNDLGGAISKTASLRNVLGVADRFVRAVESREAETQQRIKDGLKPPTPVVGGGDMIMVDITSIGDQQMAMTTCEEFSHHGVRAGCTILAALERSETDAKELIARRSPVRLVEGPPATPGVPGFATPSEIRDNYLDLARLLVSEEAGINSAFPIFSVKDAALAKAVLGIVGQSGWSDPYALELPLGANERLQEALSSKGFPVRLLLPFGERWWLYPERLSA
ncbi:MAG: hypothetical protein OQJ99_07900 [Rhodospirillales bacterium]|nr:hypothetical protein [Rhodospirillales bacterium]MCW8861899.1 hypothetical protein [Rhodospirillales bacterium]MCW8952592.1 hypothetical protein [Rhodospirillales bacterium]MCW8969736.1 hypothetical protein [Rhodospirillales bacterium]MCW9003359.1 hypothetical protein [Rhodospirillales bacterium]